MIFRQIAIGGDRNFAYIIGDTETGKAAIVDPGCNPEKILAEVAALDLEVTHIFNTHAHPDHTGANEALKTATGAPIYSAHPCNANVLVHDGQVVEIGELELTVIHTPGHTQDSICLLAGDNLCTGDTLFVGKVGGTGFGDDARAEYDSLHQKIMTLPADTKIWPGHDYGTEPSSTVAHEKSTNPFIIQSDFDSFVHLKKNWKAYKLEHGIK